MLGAIGAASAWASLWGRPTYELSEEDLTVRQLRRRRVLPLTELQGACIGFSSSTGSRRRCLPVASVVTSEGVRWLIYAIRVPFLLPGGREKPEAAVHLLNEAIRRAHLQSQTFSSAQLPSKGAAGTASISSPATTHSYGSSVSPAEFVARLMLKIALGLEWLATLIVVPITAAVFGKAPLGFLAALGSLGLSICLFKAYRVAGSGASAWTGSASVRACFWTALLSNISLAVGGAVVFVIRPETVAVESLVFGTLVAALLVHFGLRRSTRNPGFP